MPKSLAISNQTRWRFEITGIRIGAMSVAMSIRTYNLGGHQCRSAEAPGRNSAEEVPRKVPVRNGVPRKVPKNVLRVPSPEKIEVSKKVTQK